jgi:hypothetical protein
MWKPESEVKIRRKGCGNPNFGSEKTEERDVGTRVGGEKTEGNLNRK